MNTDFPRLGVARSPRNCLFRLARPRGETLFAELLIGEHSAQSTSGQIVESQGASCALSRSAFVDNHLSAVSWSVVLHLNTLIASPGQPRQCRRAGSRACWREHAKSHAPRVTSATPESIITSSVVETRGNSVEIPVERVTHSRGIPRESPWKKNSPSTARSPPLAHR